MSLEITPRRDGDVLTLSCLGRLETATAPILQKALDEIPASSRNRVLLMFLSIISFQSLLYETDMGWTSLKYHARW